MRQPWNRKEALEKGKARTRDGRLVLKLQESILNGKPVLTGYVSTKRRYKVGDIIKCEPRWWEGKGGWGHHGDDDLCDA